LEAVPDCVYRTDLLVDERTLVENKAVDVIHSVDRARVLPYLKPNVRSIDFLLVAYQAWNSADYLVKTINRNL
jgi:hypothetical protein